MSLRSMLLRARRCSLFAIIGMAAACAPPLQNGGVVVQEGAPSRLLMVCRWRHGEVQGEDPCALGAERTPPSRVRRMAADADKLTGPLAHGRAGDYLIENDEIAAVIEQLGQGSGGTLVDAADARARRDELGQMATSLGAPPRQVVYEAMDSGVDERGVAWVEARGHELSAKELAVATRYELPPGARALVITTALENKTGAPIEGLDLGDVIQWGAAEMFTPGQEAGQDGEITAPWIGGAGQGVSYGVLSAEADASLSVKIHAEVSEVSLARGVSLAPGKKAEMQRLLVVGPRGDTLSVATEIFVLQGGAPGGLEVELVDAAGARLGPPAGGRILLGSAKGAKAPLWMRVSPEMAAGGANAAAELAPGRYVVRFEGAAQVSTDVAVTVEQGKVAKIRLQVAGR